MWGGKGGTGFEVLGLLKLKLPVCLALWQIDPFLALCFPVLGQETKSFRIAVSRHLPGPVLAALAEFAFTALVRRMSWSRFLRDPSKRLGRTSKYEHGKPLRRKLITFGKFRPMLIEFPFSGVMRTFGRIPPNAQRASHRSWRTASTAAVRDPGPGEQTMANIRVLNSPYCLISEESTGGWDDVQSFRPPPHYTPPGDRTCLNT